MSSSPRSARRTELKRSLTKHVDRNPQWWDELPPVLTCPECDEKALRRVSGVCKLLDGTFIPKLERFQCSSCKANFFDDAAMKTIDKYRKDITAIST